MSITSTNAYKKIERLSNDIMFHLNTFGFEGKTKETINNILSNFSVSNMNKPIRREKRVDLFGFFVDPEAWSKKKLKICYQAYGYCSRCERAIVEFHYTIPLDVPTDLVFEIFNLYFDKEDIEAYGLDFTW